MKKLSLALLGVVGLTNSFVQAETLSPEQERFFESHVRPILVEKCQECHGSKKQWAELRLDSKHLMLKGGESGPAIVPGKPDESRIVQVIRYSEDDSQMPPEGKLSDEQIASLTQWVSMGAPWPESAEGAPNAPLDYFQQAKTHWAFQPVTRPEIPELPANYRAANPIDHFIAAKLKEANLPQSAPAEPRTQLRRLTFDLIGLPAEYQKVAEFSKNPSAEAWNAAVDELLASPQFGEKWARHWLDVARYADTKGYVFTEERRYPFAYTYRDYVIKALNEDLPYDQFIREQLAADLLPEKRSQEALAALGFLTVGQRFRNSTVDILDDRIDVTTRGLLGMTLACARCHDHKFDPLEAADYYAFYGVFDSSYEPEQLPQIGEANDKEAYAKYAEELAKLEKELHDYNAKVAEDVNKEIAAHFEYYLHAVLSEGGNHQLGRYDLQEKYDLRRRVRDELTKFLRSSSLDHPVLGLWRRLHNLKDEEFATQGVERVGNLLAQQKQGKYAGNPLLIAELEAHPPTHMYDVVKMYSKLMQSAQRPVNEIPENERAAAEEIRNTFYGESSPLVYDAKSIEKIFHRDERNKNRNLVKKVDALTVNSPGAPPRAMVVYDKERPSAPVIFKRGNPGMRGDRVDRRFLKVLNFVREEPYSDQSSGRLELAQAIATPDNPLTARVFVNRVWMLLVGQPLVESTDDFGLRTAPPSHPELLDHLASQFMEKKWSVKWLIREIVTSETYRQSSLASAVGLEADIENELVWRMNRKRLPFESMRDAMLTSAKILDNKMYGRAEVIDGDKLTHRRSIYAFIDRNNVSNLLRTFDVAGPNATVTERPRTTVPQQALYGLNSPFVLQLSQKIAENVQKTAAQQTASERIQRLYQEILQRRPEPTELAWCGDYLASQQNSQEAWQELAQALLLTNEFLFID